MVRCTVTPGLDEEIKMPLFEFWATFAQCVARPPPEINQRKQRQRGRHRKKINHPKPGHDNRGNAGGNAQADKPGQPSGHHVAGHAAGVALRRSLSQVLVVPVIGFRGGGLCIYAFATVFVLGLLLTPMRLPCALRAI